METKMYVRPPDPSRQRVKVPENYSGHAFREPSIYSDMPPPIRVDAPPTERRESFDRSPIEPQDSMEIATESEEATSNTLMGEDIHKNSDGLQRQLPSPTISQTESKHQSIFSSLLPSNSSMSGHFPFGHGIGSEEILILAMMLLVFLSGEGDGQVDNEMLLLLGLLLFAG